MMRCFYFVLIFALMFTTNSQYESTNKSRVYIVYMGASTSHKGAPRTDHFQLLNEHTNMKKNRPVVHVYNKSFLGFAALLSEAEAKSIAKTPGVVSVFPDSMLKLHTTRSWDFLASQSFYKSLDDSTPTSSRYNVSNWSSGGRRDIIIAVIDSGICPQHPSFNDEHTGPIPKQWNGTCENSTLFQCNRKVIGARYYDNPIRQGSITTALDEDGHGTHVASIAAGVPVPGASYYGLAYGTAMGGSPCSRLAVYCACRNDRCASSSILKAFDDAISDGVDVISASIGFDADSFLNDPVAVGAFHATEKGVVVVASVGNDGPDPETVVNYSPWILSVGASTMDRDFQCGIVLGGRKDVIKGGGINFSNLNKSAVYQLVDGGSAGYNQRDLFNADNCVPGSLDVAKVKGRIVLCNNNDNYRLFSKINAMVEQGVIGIIMIDDSRRQRTFNYPQSIVITAVSQADGAQIQSYINSAKNPLATILPTEVILRNKPAPVVSIESSRGPGIRNLLKPDVMAPGLAVLGAWPLNDTSRVYPRNIPPLFSFGKGGGGGTSMACPHVSGVAATVKYMHPTWSNSAIRSAIMTTAIQTNNENAPITTFQGSSATPYDIGSGEITLFGPLCPGLVYETETADYMQFLCNLGYTNSMIKLMSSTVPDNFSCPSNSNPDYISDLNYPWMAVSGLVPGVAKTVKRTVTNVGPFYSTTYKVLVEAPVEVHVEVVPNKLEFTGNVKKLSFEVTFILTASSQEDLFGSITWSDYFHKVRSPFVVSNT